MNKLAVGAYASFVVLSGLYIAGVAFTLAVVIWLPILFILVVIGFVTTKIEKEVTK